VNEFDLIEYNLKVIHRRLLVAEAVLSKRTGGKYAGARHEILTAIAARHAYTLKTTACCEFLQAWRQLVFATLEHFNVLSESEREEILFDLLEVCVRDCFVVCVYFFQLFFMTTSVSFSDPISFLSFPFSIPGPSL
jgi:hypothetical protein